MDAEVNFYIDEKELTAFIEVHYCPGDWWTPPCHDFELHCVEFENRDISEIVERWAKITKTDLDEMIQEKYKNQIS